MTKTAATSARRRATRAKDGAASRARLARDDGVAVSGGE